MTPDPATGQRVLDPEGVAEYIGIDAKVMQGVRAREAARPPMPAVPQQPAGGAVQPPAVGGMTMPPGTTSLPEELVP
jgi:hypothetical protein